MAIRTARRIGVCEAIDERHLRMPAYNRLDIDRLRIASLQSWNCLESIQYQLNSGRVFALKSTNHHILASLETAPSFIQHLIRLANSSGIAKKDLELASPLSTLIQLDLGQKL